jgi:hypothetical protein
VNYAENRDAEQLRILTPAIDSFIVQLHKPPKPNSLCQRQTVFFFPGGMASRLVQAQQPYQDGVGAPPNVGYDDLWIVCDTFLGGWRKLRMHKDAMGCFRDVGDRIVVADGAVSLMGCTPHDGLIKWCAANNADLFVFGWDWRRRLDETVAFFLGKFLPFFRARAMNDGLPDPLARFSLVGHSLGGMIVNLILRSSDPIIANLARAITVATPFYGYPGQLHRWFEGEPLLMESEMEGFDALANAGFGDLAEALRQATRQEMLQVIASLPGLYVLHFLDEVTFADPATQATLTTDANFPLASYPSVDATVPALRADAYNPQANGSLVRYPANTGFDPSELAYARLQFQQLTAQMSPQLLEKFCNIRGVVTQTDGVTPVNSTAGSVTWAWIQPHFIAGDPTPIVDSGSVPGDDTQPAWSARYARNAATCINVLGSDIEHYLMMNHEKVIAEIGKILCRPPATAGSAPSPAQPDTASEKEVKDFLRWLYKHRRRKKWPPLDKIPPDFLPERFGKRLPAIGRRILKDLMRGPRSPARKPGRGGGKPPRRRRPSKRSRTK